MIMDFQFLNNKIIEIINIKKSYRPIRMERND